MEITHTNESWWHRGHHVFQEGIEFSLEMNIGFVFNCSRHTSTEEASLWQHSHLHCQEVTRGRTSPQVSPSEVGSPGIWATRIWARQMPIWVSSKLTEGAKVTYPPNGCVHQQSSTTLLMHGASLRKHSEAEGLLSAPSHQRRETDRNSCWWCQMLWAVVRSCMNLWGITNLWATALSEESKRGREVGIISCCLSERNSTGTPHNKKLETFLEWVYLPTFLSRNVCTR